MISLERVVSWNWKWHPTLSFRLQSSISLWGKKKVSEWWWLVLVSLPAEEHFFGTSPHFRSKPTNTLANQDSAPTTRPVTNHACTARVCVHACACVRAFVLESVRTRASVSARSLFPSPSQLLRRRAFTLSRMDWRWLLESWCHGLQGSGCKRVQNGLFNLLTLS